MSAAKHTPGPWTASSLGGPWEQQIRIRAENWGIVAHVGVDPGLPHWDEPQRANARLIAAAPELLDACANARDMLATDRQAFVDCQRVRGPLTEEPIAHGLVFVEEDVWIKPEDAEALGDYDKAISLIDAAIAKATGSAP